MKLLILSDLHLEVAPLEHFAECDFDVAVLAGDISSPGTRIIAFARRAIFASKPVVCVLGNHDFYDGAIEAVRTQARAAAAGTNVHLLDPGETFLSGVRFLGCTGWTDFRLPVETARGPESNVHKAMGMASLFLADYSAIQVEGRAAESDPCQGREARPLTPDDVRGFHHEERAWLNRKLNEHFPGPTVVVTHHAPSRGSLDLRFVGDWLSPCFVSELPAAFFGIPRLWIHGHTHTSFDYRVGTCRVVCNPRGFARSKDRAENPRFDPSFVVEI